MNKNRDYDAVVVGAGVFGAWAAYRLAQSGRSVLLVDAYGPANSRASSGGESRIIRMGYGRDEIYTRSALRALVAWKEIFERAGQTLFHQTGVLWMAQEEDGYALDTLATLQKAAVRFEKLERRELEKQFPQIDFSDVDWAILEPESGVVMARRAVQAVVEEARKSGCEYLAEAVTAPSGRGRLDSVRTRSGSLIRAANFAFACGPWLPRLFPQLLGCRIFPSRQEVLFFGAPPGSVQFSPPAMPTWLDLRNEIYGMPDLECRGFKVALDHHGPPMDPEAAERVASAEGIATVRAYIRRRFPALAEAPILETRICQYENTSNGDFLIDRHPNFDNVWLVGGGSGHGFKHGPTVGEYVAAQIEGSGAVEPRFSLATKEKMQRRAVY